MNLITLAGEGSKNIESTIRGAIMQHLTTVPVSRGLGDGPGGSISEREALRSSVNFACVYSGHSGATSRMRVTKWPAQGSIRSSAFVPAPSSFPNGGSSVPRKKFIQTHDIPLPSMSYQ